MNYADYDSLKAVADAFPDEDTCVQHLEMLRWNGFVTSPFDPLSKVYFCNHGRYRCRNTGKYFNAKTGTIFYNSKIELQKWFMAIWLVSTAARPITSIQMGVDLGVTQKTAWFMLRRIRKHLGLEFPKKDVYVRREKPKNLAVQQHQAVVENDKMQMHEWLQILKKS